MSIDNRDTREINITQMNTVVKKLPNGNTEIETTFGYNFIDGKVYKWEWKTGEWIANWKE